MTIPAPAATGVLLLTGDVQLREEVQRLAETVGCPSSCLDDPALASRAWQQAPLVVVGDDLSADVARARLPRREDVVLIGQDLDDGDVWRRAVSVGAEHVLFLPEATDWLLDSLGAAAEGTAEEGVVVAVVGGRGGAGATTLAAALAVTAKRLGRPAALVDGDPLGGGIDLVLGGEAAVGLRWPALLGTRGRLRSAAVAEALPDIEGLRVLSWDRGAPAEIPAGAMDAVLTACARASEVTVVDLPRRLDEASRVVLAHAGVVLVVVPAEVRAAAAAARVAAGLVLHHDDIRLVVRGPAPARLSPSTVAATVGLPLTAAIKPEAGLAVRLERGEAPARTGRGHLARFCATFLADVLPEPTQVAA